MEETDITILEENQSIVKPKKQKSSIVNYFLYGLLISVVIYLTYNLIQRSSRRKQEEEKMNKYEKVKRDIDAFRNKKDYVPYVFPTERDLFKKIKK